MHTICSESAVCKRKITTDSAGRIYPVRYPRHAQEFALTYWRDTWKPGTQKKTTKFDRYSSLLRHLGHLQDCAPGRLFYIIRRRDVTRGRWENVLRRGDR